MFIGRLFDSDIQTRQGKVAVLGRLAVVVAIASASVVLPPSTRGQESKPATPAQPLAVFQGQPMTESDLPEKEQAQLLRMMQQVYGVQMRGVHETLDQKLIEAEAKRRGVTADELFKTEITAKVTPPTDEQVDTYYKDHQASFRQSADEAKAKIRLGLLNEQLQNREAAYKQELMAQAVASGEVQLLIRPPKIDVTADPERVRGAAKAPVTIVEFSDFSCPYCRNVESTLTELLAKYPGEVKIAYRDFPLTQLHPNAELAAEASRCAGEQGKFWEYHDVLFAHSSKQTREDLLQYASDTGLDPVKLDSCLATDRYKSPVERDLQLGIRSGVLATPGFFVNGRFLSGAQPAEAFERIIDEELANAKRKTAPPALKDATTASLH